MELRANFGFSYLFYFIWFNSNLKLNFNLIFSLTYLIYLYQLNSLKFRLVNNKNKLEVSGGRIFNLVSIIREIVWWSESIECR